MFTCHLKVYSSKQFNNGPQLKPIIVSSVTFLFFLNPFFFSFHHCAKKTLLINEASNPAIGSIPLPQAMKEPQGVVCY